MKMRIYRDEAGAIMCVGLVAPIERTDAGVVIDAKGNGLAVVGADGHVLDPYVAMRVCGRQEVI